MKFFPGYFSASPTYIRLSRIRNSRIIGFALRKKSFPQQEDKRKPFFNFGITGLEEVRKCEVFPEMNQLLFGHRKFYFDNNQAEE